MPSRFALFSCSRLGDTEKHRTRGHPVLSRGWRKGGIDCFDLSDCLERKPLLDRVFTDPHASRSSTTQDRLMSWPAA